MMYIKRCTNAKEEQLCRAILVPGSPRELQVTIEYQHVSFYLWQCPGLGTSGTVQ